MNGTFHDPCEEETQDLVYTCVLFTGIVYRLKDPDDWPDQIIVKQGLDPFDSITETLHRCAFKLRSRLFTEWVNAPTDMMSTPVNA